MYGRNGVITICEIKMPHMFFNILKFCQYFVLVFVLMVLGITGSVVGMTQVCHEASY